MREPINTYFFVSSIGAAVKEGKGIWSSLHPFTLSSLCPGEHFPLPAVGGLWTPLPPSRIRVTKEYELIPPLLLRCTLVRWTDIDLMLNASWITRGGYLPTLSQEYEP